MTRASHPSDAWTRRLLNRGTLLLALSTVSSLAPRPAVAQSVEDVQRYADRIFASCDYAGYIAKANEMVQKLSVISDVKNVYDWWRAARLARGGIILPVTDVVQFIANEGTRRASERQLLETKRGVIKMLENACQSYVTSRNMQREYTVSAMAAMGVAKDWKDALKDLELKQLKAPDDVTGGMRALAQANVRGKAGDSRSEDLLGRFADSAALSGAESAKAAARALAIADASLDSLKAELRVYATTNRQGALVCPDSFPALPAVIPASQRTANGVVCGPASPGRARQVHAMMQAIQTEERLMIAKLKANQLALDAATEVQAVITKRKRLRALANSTSAMSGG